METQFFHSFTGGTPGKQRRDDSSPQMGVIVNLVIIEFGNGFCDIRDLRQDGFLELRCVGNKGI